MKTITGILVAYALAAPAAPAAAQGHYEYQIERIISSALTLAADALDDAVADRAARQRGPARGRETRGPEYTEKFDKTVRLGRNGRLELTNLSGNVEITGGSGDDVKVSATKVAHAADEQTARTALTATTIEVIERSGVVTISAQPTRGRSTSVEVNYVISVPTGTSLALRTYSGDVTVTNVSSDIRLNSLSGDIVVKDGKPSMIEIDSVSGDVSLEQAESERIQVNSVSGDIVFKGKLAKTGRYEFKTHSGDVQVITDEGASFVLEAGTLSGDVSSDFALKLTGSGTSFLPRDRGPRRNGDIHGVVSDGGAVLSLHSFSGDILISKR
jgi:DUF4097 and DUF4098 domain-containing protein YvlB